MIKNISIFFLTRVDTHRLKGQVVVVEAADEKLKAELEKEVRSVTLHVEM